MTPYLDDTNYKDINCLNHCIRQLPGVIYHRCHQTLGKQQNISVHAV